MTAHQQVPGLVEHKQRVVASRSQPLCTTRSTHATPTARFLGTAGSHYIDRAWVKQMAQSRAERDIRLTTWASSSPRLTASWMPMLRSVHPWEMHVRGIGGLQDRLSRHATAWRVTSMNLEIFLDLNAVKYYYHSCSHPSPLGKLIAPAIYRSLAHRFTCARRTGLHSVCLCAGCFDDGAALHGSRHADSRVAFLQGIQCRPAGVDHHPGSPRRDVYGRFG